MNRIIAKLMISVLAVGLPVAVLTSGCQQSKSPKKDGYSFSNPVKSAHYESNTPAQAEVLAAVPTNVVINFNFDLAPESKISIKKDDKEYGVGKTVVDKDKLTMRRNMNPKAPNGLYTVEYRAFWPDKSYHDGSFQFAIDKKKRSEFKDETGKKQVTIEMADISFKPKNVLIDEGTAVTWINKESVVHYVNTDSHPAHTYFPPQNSKALKEGEEFTLTFDKPGIYPYHCSAHADQMTGTIIVE